MGQFRRLTSWDLKWIALVTMCIDHVGAVLFPAQNLFRIAGRISFPIFCFLIVEGFVHTHDLQKYIGRMFLFALVTEIPFDLAFYGTWLEFSHQNVMFTFTLSLILLAMLHDVQENTQSLPVGFQTLLKILCCLFIMALAWLLRVDYSYFGVLLVLIFYLFYREPKTKFLLAALENILCGGLQAFAVLSIPFLLLYNGKEGRKMKYLFYIFYPAHLLILAVLGKEFMF
jgi:hypothetical protein